MLETKDSLTLLWTFDSDLKAEQAKHLLESHGYFAHLNSSYSSRFNYYEVVTNMANFAGGGVRLLTKKSQAYDAYVMLAMHDFVPMGDLVSRNSGIDNFRKMMSKVPVLRSFGLFAQLVALSILISLVLLLVTL